MTVYVPPLEKIKISDLQLSSDTDSQFQEISKKVIEDNLIDYQEVLIRFHLSSHALILKLGKTSKGYWIATSDEFTTYGNGNSAVAAIQNFVEILEEYYQELIDEEDILGPFLKKELSNLRKYFQ